MRKYVIYREKGILGQVHALQARARLACLMKQGSQWLPWKEQVRTGHEGKVVRPQIT